MPLGRSCITARDLGGSHQTWPRARALLPKADDSSMPLGRSCITARDLDILDPELPGLEGTTLFDMSTLPLDG